jgi:hypothetical protein
LKQTNALQPPANIAIPSFGSDVAARAVRAALRAAVVQAPLFTLKMSTALVGALPAQSSKNKKKQDQHAPTRASWWHALTTIPAEQIKATNSHKNNEHAS